MIYRSRIRFLAGMLCMGMLLFLTQTGCEHHGPVQPVAVSSTFNDIQQNIFNKSCAVSGCHIGPSAPLGQDLSSGNSYGDIVNVPSREIPRLLRVNPGNPDSSYLVLKIEGDPLIHGGRMPLGGSKLPQSDIDAIRNWIMSGAPDN